MKKYTYEELYEIAFNDALTGLNNRSFFEKCIKKNKQYLECYVFFVDLDGLKEINDKFGHTKGDQLLKDIANMFSSMKYCCNNEICTIRYGGDEFLILCDYDDKNTIKAYLDSFQIYGKLNYSYGYTIKTRVDSWTNAIKIADKQMYKMKNSKKTN